MATPTASAALDAGPGVATIDSPTATPSFSSTATPSATGVSSDDAKHNTKMSNLYLVTFLATLFILLLISGAIIMRSYFLRRRYQRRLEEALASGLVLAPHAQGGKRKRFGAKPGLFEVYVRGSAHPTYKSGSENAKYGPPSVGEKDTFMEKDPLGVVGGGGRVVDSLPWGSWGTIIPLSAQPIFVKRKYCGIAEPSSTSPGRLINLNNIIDPTLLVHPGPPADGASILATRPPPSRFLNLVGIDSEAYSVAYLSAQHANRERRTQEAQRRADVQAAAVARVRRFERLVRDAWGISGPRRATNANGNTDAALGAERGRAPSVLTPEQRANNELEATSRSPATPDGEGERLATVVAQIADATRVVGSHVPVPVPGEDSDSEDDGGTEAVVGGQSVQAQRQRTGQEQGVVLDAEFGVNTAASVGAGSTAPTAIPAAARISASTASAPAGTIASAPAPAPLPEAAIPEGPSVPPFASLTSVSSDEITQPAVVPGPPPVLPVQHVKIRVEMLQIAVLIAMPTPTRKCRFGKSPSTLKSKAAPTKITTTAAVRPRLRASLDEDLDEVSVKSLSTDGEYVDCAESLNADVHKKGDDEDDDDDDDDEWDGDRPLPEVVVGVARVQYQHPSDLNSSAGVVSSNVIAHADENDTLRVTGPGTRVAATSRTTARRPTTTTRGSSLGGSAAFGIPG